MKRITYLLIGLLVMSLPVVSALDLTTLAKNSGAIKLNKNQQTKVETALGIDLSQLTGVSTNNIHVTLNNVLQIGSLYILIATINGQVYTIVVPAYKLAKYIT